MRCLSIYLTLLVTSQTLLFGQTKLSDLKSPFSRYIVSTKECSMVTHHSGSIILIPALAFDVDVSEVDFVTILYREIRTPAETLVHNIQMNIELVGKRYLVESNGMFEIYSMNEKDTIQVHEDRSIVVRMALQRQEVDVTMEGFKYNNSSSLWESYNKVQNLFLTESDDDLWGSSEVNSSGGAVGNVEVGFGAGWDDEWELDSVWARQESLREVAFQSMEIFDFGLYNYDKIISEEEYVPYVPTFVNEQNEEIKTDVYVIYEGLNTVIYFQEYNWKNSFTLIKGRKYSMFTLDNNGQIYKLNSYPELGMPESEIIFILQKEAPLPKDSNGLSDLIAVK